MGKVFRVTSERTKDKSLCFRSFLNCKSDFQKWYSLNEDILNVFAFFDFHYTSFTSTCIFIKNRPNVLFKYLETDYKHPFSVVHGFSFCTCSMFWIKQINVFLWKNTLIYIITCIKIMKYQKESTETILDVGNYINVALTLNYYLKAYYSANYFLWRIISLIMLRTI